MKWIATLVVAAAALGLCYAASPCPPNFINFSDSDVEPLCLLFVSSTGTWYDMLHTCEMLGASLAKITEDLHSSVYHYIRDDSVLTDKCFWIGGTDEEMETHWVWVNDKTEIPLGGPHWDPCDEEPNGDYDENYLAICPDRYYYKDYPGDRHHYGICQMFF